jgi:hypothetical protein
MAKSVNQSSGWSLCRFEGAWHHDAVSQASIADDRIVIELEQEGDTVTVTAKSTDGIRYAGDYRYREGSYSNGEVFFERFTGPAGHVFVGERREIGQRAELWVIKMDAS